MPCPKCRDQAYDSADQEDPADDDGEVDGGERRQDDGGQAENDQNDPFGQKQPPMGVNGAGKRAAKTLSLWFVDGHRLPPSMQSDIWNWAATACCIFPDGGPLPIGEVANNALRGA